ncbi:MAG: transporter, partial [Rikenellaceae bacterium]
MEAIKGAIIRNRRPLLMLISMLLGVLSFRPIARLDDSTGNIVAPLLIFLMLFVTFCRVRIRDLRLSKLHFALLAFQLVVTPVAYYALLPFGEIVAQGGMVCFLAPIAMAAVAVGALLGANVTTMVSYTLICNLVMAFV